MIMDGELDTGGELDVSDTGSRGSSVSTVIINEPLGVTVQVAEIGPVTDLKFGLTKIWPRNAHRMVIRGSKEDASTVMPTVQNIVIGGKYFYLEDFAKKVERRAKPYITFFEFMTAVGGM